MAEDKKKTGPTVGGALSAAAGVYLVFAFGNWCMYPGFWPDHARFFCAFLVLFAAGFYWTYPGHRD